MEIVLVGEVLEIEASVDIKIFGHVIGGLNFIPMRYDDGSC